MCSTSKLATASSTLAATSLIRAKSACKYKGGLGELDIHLYFAYMHLKIANTEKSIMRTVTSYTISSFIEIYELLS